MRPTNVHCRDEFFVKNQCVIIQKDRDEDQEDRLASFKSKKSKKGGNNSAKTFKTEEKNSTIASIVNQEHGYLRVSEVKVPEDPYENDIHYSYYDHLDENLNFRAEKEFQIETKYAWAHLS
jgi:hypothetical protein